jgi:hypothetical protein
MEWVRRGKTDRSLGFGSWTPLGKALLGFCIACYGLLNLGHGRLWHYFEPEKYGHIRRDTLDSTEEELLELLETLFPNDENPSESQLKKNPIPHCPMSLGIQIQVHSKTHNTENATIPRTPCKPVVES